MDSTLAWGPQPRFTADQAAGGRVRTKTLLVVEDNPDDETIILRALAQCGIPVEILTARSGEAALGRLRELGFFSHEDADHRLNVILVDLRMPGMNGFELIRLLRSDPATRRVPIVAFTSSNEVRDVRAAYEAGASSYVQKPVESATFQEAIKTLARYWFTLNEPPG